MECFRTSMSLFQVIVNDLGEDSEAHAGKLIEVILLQCQENMSAVCSSN